MDMYRTTGILTLGLMLATAGFSQQPELWSLADMAGLCREYRPKGPVSGSNVPCSDCELYWVMLQGQLPRPDLFFVEVRSPYHCGSGGCTGSVFQRYSEGYRKLFSLFGRIDRERSRPEASPPVIVYQHDLSPRYDFTGDGAADRATVWAKYRWQSSSRRFFLFDIIRIEAGGRSIPLRGWRERLLQAWHQESPWLY